MPFQIDISQPFRLPSELRTLVQAVHGADPHDEHLWIEWKSRLDLTAPSGLQHVARHILGLANRDPSGAAYYAGGYGYLLVGVQPGQLVGVQTIDPEQMVAKIRALVGDVTRWTPEYVDVSGKRVLVVVVNPPRPGDPIHVLRRKIGNYEPGTVFARHPGRTDQATPGDMEMLQARLLERTPGLEFAVTPVLGTIEAWPEVADAAENWTQDTAPGLLAARHHEKPCLPSAFNTNAFTAISAATLAFGGKQVIPDKRTQEEYEAEVSEYLNQARNAFCARAAWRLFRHGPTHLQLVALNPTDQHFKAVRLCVHISGRVYSYSGESLRDVEEDKEWPFPARPRPLGTPTIKDPLAQFANLGFLTNFDVPKPGFVTRRGFTIKDTGSVRIEYDDFSLRSGEKITLDRVPLIVGEPAGTELEVEWSATAADTRGRLSGQFLLSVVQSTLDLDSIPSDQ